MEMHARVILSGAKQSRTFAVFRKSASAFTESEGAKRDLGRCGTLNLVDPQNANTFWLFKIRNLLQILKSSTTKHPTGMFSPLRM
ncbi:MAG: hypothetical protein J6S34_00175, partial [Clostridia bacterium]|nr:hypothetical protein [Clostridia bacterium]